MKNTVIPWDTQSWATRAMEIYGFQLGPKKFWGTRIKVVRTFEIDTQVFHALVFSLHEISEQSRGFLVQKTVYHKALLYMVVYSAYVFFLNSYQKCPWKLKFCSSWKPWLYLDWSKSRFTYFWINLLITFLITSNISNYPTHFSHLLTRKQNTFRAQLSNSCPKATTQLHSCQTAAQTWISISWPADLWLIDPKNRSLVKSSCHVLLSSPFSQ